MKMKKGNEVLPTLWKKTIKKNKLEMNHLKSFKRNGESVNCGITMSFFFGAKDQTR